VYALFDYLTLLSYGRTIFFGEAASAAEVNHSIPVTPTRISMAALSPFDFLNAVKISIHSTEASNLEQDLVVMS
jgi:hypothetical protein